MRPEALLAVGQELVQDASADAAAAVRRVDDQLDRRVADGVGGGDDRAVGSVCCTSTRAGDRHAARTGSPR